MYTWSIDLHRDVLKIAKVVKKNRPSAGGAKAVNQGASTTYVYVVDRPSPGCFKKLLKLSKKIALVPVALKRLIRVHLPPMYTWGLRDNQVDFSGFGFLT
jgi:hypothetical protein